MAAAACPAHRRGYRQIQHNAIPGGFLPDAFGDAGDLVATVVAPPFSPPCDSAASKACPASAAGDVTVAPRLVF
jgi:hypothetical protein